MNNRGKKRKKERNNKCVWFIAKIATLGQTRELNLKQNPGYGDNAKLEVSKLSYCSSGHSVLANCGLAVPHNESNITKC